MTHGRALAAALAALALVLGACGEDDEGPVDGSGGTNTTGNPVATVKVSETEYVLTPGGASVSKPGVVRFEVSNDGKVDHALAVEGPDGAVETETIPPGEKATLRADLSKAGSYEWYCPIADHKERGMKGDVSVAIREEPGGKREAGSDGHGGYSY